MATMAEIKKQIEELAAPFHEIAVAAREAPVDQIANQAEAVRSCLMSGQHAAALRTVGLMLERIGRFHETLPRLQAAIRAVETSSVVDEWRVEQEQQKGVR